MKLFSISLFWIFFTSSLFAYNPNTRIINGSPVAFGDNQWTVSLFRADLSPKDGHYCGGSIIAKNWVLTAAHCLKDHQDPNFMKIYSGSVSLESGGKIYKVKRVIVHPRYNDITVDNDVGLLEIYGEFDIEPLKIADRYSSYYNTGTMLTVTGWGSTSASYYRPSTTLMEVDVPVVSNELCNSPYSYDGEITDNMMCAGYTEGGKDACTGDSGGPLFIEDSNGVTQVGIVSWGISCAMANYFGIYTRIGNYKEWIEGYIGKEEESSNCDKKLFSMVTRYNEWFLLGAGNLGGCSVEGIKALGAKSVYYFKNNQWQTSGAIPDWYGVWILK